MYNYIMADIRELAVETYNEQRAQFSGRKATIVRVFGQEHNANFVSNKATFFFPVDTDLAYISELGIKIILGDYASSGPSAGGVIIPPVGGSVNKYGTYLSWIEAFPEGAAIDMDGSYGCQCWDYADAFWVSQVNRTLQTGPSHGVWECWATSRTVNAGDDFDLIHNVSDVKRGDWIVWDKGRFSGDTTGHIAMAADNYNGTGIIRCYGQNQGGFGITVKPLSEQRFLGAFRYKPWWGNGEIIV